MATIPGTALVDTLIGALENDLITGADGADSLRGGVANDTLSGDNANDTLVGDDGGDLLLGGNGIDRLRGELGNDTLDGGGDSDRLFGWRGDDVMVGGEGRDTLDGEQDHDRLDGGADNDRILGGIGNDTLDGGEGNDTLYGGIGDDSIQGGAGNDIAFGSMGRDSIDGGDGHDTLHGGINNDTISGGNHHDLIFGDLVDRTRPRANDDTPDGVVSVPDGSVAAGGPRNVLLISADDMNNWAFRPDLYSGPVHTPNLDALFGRGTLFTDAHAQVPVCNASRTSALTGLNPWESGVGLLEDWKDLVPNAITLPRHFKDLGYQTVSIGKVFHQDSNVNSDDPLAWNSATPMSNLTGPYTVGGNHPDAVWGTVPDATGTPDHKAATLVENFLAQAPNSPFFLAVGFSQPHWPWFIPQSYYDKYPLSQIQLPDRLGSDLADVPAEGVAMATLSRSTADDNVNVYKQAVQGYLAALSFLDDQVGRVMQALEASGKASNTLVVFWSDNGYHMGEKGHFGKQTLWNEATNVPLAFAGPGVAQGQVIDKAVGLIDMYRTITDLAGVPPTPGLDSKSLKPLIENPNVAWDRPVLSLVDGAMSVRTDQYHYIRYVDGTDELYDVTTDPHEFTNLAERPAFADVVRDLARWIPSGDDVLSGGAGNDTIVAGSGADTASGDSGNDLVTGGAGNDSLDGGGGNDTLVAAIGDDTAVGGSGNDSITGGVGDDRLLGDAGDDTIDGSANADSIWGGDGLDLILGGGGADQVFGGNDADSILGGDGADTIAGESGNDTLGGDGGFDRLDGGAGNDLIAGGADNDTILAGGGHDTIAGGAGRDQLEGGAGADRFVYRAIADSFPGAQRDTISDFDTAMDTLAFEGLKTGQFQWRGGGNFLVDANSQARYAGGIVQIDVNGDGALDMEIRLANAPVDLSLINFFWT